MGKRGSIIGIKSIIPSEVYISMLIYIFFKFNCKGVAWRVANPVVSFVYMCVCNDSVLQCSGEMRMLICDILAKPM